MRDEDDIHNYLGLTGEEIIAAGGERALVPLAMELRKTVRSPAIAKAWIRRSLPALQDQRPIDLILRGNTDRILALLRDLNWGLFS